MSTITPDRATAPLILAIDIGTSSVRVNLFDRLGRAVEGSEARQFHEIRTTPEGAAEADPDALAGLVWRCLDLVLDRAGHLTKEVGGVAICTLVGNILGLDGNGRALTPLVTYADTRAANEVASLRAELDEEAVHDRTGCPFHPGYLPAYFRWFARTQRDLFHRVARWVSIGEYLELKLFGETAVSYSVASWTGLLDRHKMVWDEPLLSALLIKKDQLSPLVDASAQRKVLHHEFASRWPSLKSIPWFPPLGDGATANIGSGCISPKRVALTVGTTSALRSVVDYPVERIPEGLWCYRVDGRRSLPGGALSEGGNVFAWMRNTLQLGELSKLEENLVRREPDGHGLTVLPFFAGERSPGWAGHARAAIHGLSFATTPLDVLHAGLEAVAYRVAVVFESICKLLPDNPGVVASGGALLSSPAWLQIMTDVLGRPVAVSTVQEASGRGAALLALEALGVLKDLKEAPDFVGEVYQPDTDRHARYQKAIERQKVLYGKLVKGEK